MKYYINIVTVVIYLHKFDFEHSINIYDYSVTCTCMHMPWYLIILLFFKEKSVQEYIALYWNNALK